MVPKPVYFVKKPTNPIFWHEKRCDGAHMVEKPHLNAPKISLNRVNYPSFGYNYIQVGLFSAFMLLRLFSLCGPESPDFLVPNKIDLSHISSEPQKLICRRYRPTVGKEIE